MNDLAVNTPDLVAIEDHIAELLTPIVVPLVTDPFPDRPDEYVDSIGESAAGAVLVAAATGRKAGGTEATGEFEVDVECTILSPHLRGDGGALIVLPLIIEAVDGQRTVVGDEPYYMSVADFGFAGRTRDLWEYAIRVTLTPVLALSRRAR